jgi:hypothetical protein
VQGAALRRLFLSSVRHPKGKLQRHWLLDEE